MEHKKVELKIKAQGGETGKKCVRALASVIIGMQKAAQEDKKCLQRCVWDT